MILPFLKGGQYPGMGGQYDPEWGGQYDPEFAGWVWQSIFSLGRSCAALYFTNSTALRAALPCKISSRFFIFNQPPAR